jgi:hypothetical protein
MNDSWSFFAVCMVDTLTVVDFSKAQLPGLLG